MNHWIKKIVFLLSSCCIMSLSAHASIVEELLSQLETDFVEVSSRSAESIEIQRGVHDLSRDHDLLMMNGLGSASAGAVDQTPPSAHSDLSSPATRWISLLPVNQDLFSRVLGAKLSAHSIDLSLPVRGVKYQSTGDNDSIEEFFSVLNQLAKEEGAAFRFKLPEEEDYYFSFSHGGVVFGGVQEWTATRPRAPYASRLVIGFDPELSPHQGVVVLDQTTFPDLNSMFLDPSFYSDKTQLGFRMVIEVKPKAARVLFD